MSNPDRAPVAADYRDRTGRVIPLFGLRRADPPCGTAQHVV